MDSESEARREKQNKEAWTEDRIKLFFIVSGSA